MQQNTFGEHVALPRPIHSWIWGRIELPGSIGEQEIREMMEIKGAPRLSPPCFGFASFARIGDCLFNVGPTP